MNKAVKKHSTSTNFLFGGGELGARMRAKDWSTTPLGAVETWPQSLKTAVRIILTCRQPMFVWWGKDFINLYNDAYRSVAGNKHPEALGQPAESVWAEIWDQVGTRAKSVILNNEGTFDELLLLLMKRYGYVEETYWTFSYSPIPNDQDETGGIICACNEETHRVLAERQLALLKELATKTVDAWSFDSACVLSAKCLETNPYDLPFAMIYQVDPAKESVSLSATCAIERDHSAVVEMASVNSNEPWPFAEAIKSNKLVLVTDLVTKFTDLPKGAWDTPPHQAVLIPIAPSGQKGKSSILVVGLNPHRLFDDNYKTSLELVAAQISASIANAQNYEEERKRADELAKIDRAKTIFFSNISHEFRTPITLLLGPIEDALSGGYGELSEQHKEWIERAHRNCLRLLKLVNTLLDFSRIEAGRIKAFYQPTDLANFTAELASGFRSVIEKAGIELIVDCPPLPEPIYIDRDMWEKIILNLLSNAFKFTFQGKITISLHWDNDFATLSVSDTGSGIAQEDLSHLFERFYRVLNAKARSHEGTGIGLALVQELVRLHCGKVSVESKLGEGSKFIVQIPTGKNHLPAEHIGSSNNTTIINSGIIPYIEETLQWVSSTEKSTTGENSVYNQSHFIDQPNSETTAKAKILLVEDNADMSNYIKRLLSQYWEVETAANGKEALEAISENPLPDLILSDVMMPEVDGIELLKTLRANDSTRSVPIILLSARAGEESQIEGLNFGADDYLVKPFSARELLARTNTHLELNRIRKETAKQVEQAEIRVREIIESITDGFFAIDKNWRYTFVNQVGVKITGKLPSELLGKTVWDVFPDLVGSQTYYYFQQAMSKRTSSKFEVFSEQNQTWFENNIYPAEDGIVVLFKDITEQKQAEDEKNQLLKKAEQANKTKDESITALKQAEHELVRLAAIVESSYDPIISLTLEGIILSCNASAERLYGYSNKEICGRHISILFPDGYTNYIPKLLMPINRGEAINNFEVMHVSKSGSILEVSLTAFPVKDKSGEIINSSVIVHDITERKYIERERAKLLRNNNS